MAGRGLWLSAAAGTASVGVLAAWLVEGWGGPLATRAADDLGLLAFSVFATVSSVRAAGRRHGRARSSWLAMAVGLAGWTIGELVWCYYELWLRVPQTPFPSPADAGYLTFPLGAAAALILFPADRVARARIRLCLDGVIVTGSLFIVSWLLVLEHVYRAGGTSRFALSVALAYPLADVVLVTMTVVTLAQARTAQRLILGLLAAGIILMSLSDSGFAYLTATNPYVTGDPIDLGWLTAFLLFGLAAAGTDDHGPVRRQMPGQVSLWLPYVPLLLAAVVGAHRALSGLRSGPILPVCLLLVIAVLGRQFIAIAENNRLLRTVAHQAFHDPLTGVANRALFGDRLNHAAEQYRRDVRPMAVVCLDLDGFKQVNDTYGHAVGDRLLIGVADRLRGCLRAGDTIARLGGDEFAVLLQADHSGAIRAAQRILETFTEPFVIEGHTLPIRPSIGLATAHDPGPAFSAESLMHEADQAMYAAKRSGAGGLRTATPAVGALP